MPFAGSEKEMAGSKRKAPAGRAGGASDDGASGGSRDERVPNRTRTRTRSTYVYERPPLALWSAPSTSLASGVTPYLGLFYVGLFAASAVLIFSTLGLSSSAFVALGLAAGAMGPSFLGLWFAVLRPNRDLISVYHPLAVQMFLGSGAAIAALAVRYGLNFGIEAGLDLSLGQEASYGTDTQRLAHASLSGILSAFVSLSLPLTLIEVLLTHRISYAPPVVSPYSLMVYSVCSSIAISVIENLAQVLIPIVWPDNRYLFPPTPPSSLLVSFLLTVPLYIVSGLMVGLRFSYLRWSDASKHIQKKGIRKGWYALQFSWILKGAFFLPLGFTALALKDALLAGVMNGLSVAVLGVAAAYYRVKGTELRLTKWYREEIAEPGSSPDADTTPALPAAPVTEESEPVVPEDD